MTAARFSACARFIALFLVTGCDGLEIDLTGWDASTHDDDGSPGATTCTASHCESGTCCDSFWDRGCARVPEPDQSTCSALVLADGTVVGCNCRPPGDLVCIDLFFGPPFSATCPDVPFSRCAMDCSERWCACETADQPLLGTAGMTIDSCPPDWTTLCPDAG